MIGEWRAVVRADLLANRGHPKEMGLLLAFRTAQAVRHVPLVGLWTLVLYRFLSEIVFSIELRPETRIGPGLRLFHGVATVVNTGVVIGANVKLHQSVTIGARHSGGPNPVIGDNVDIGAGAIILGGVRIGDGARVGAGAVVVKDVPAHAVVVGNPARVIVGRSRDLAG